MLIQKDKRLALFYVWDGTDDSRSLSLDDLVGRRSMRGRRLILFGLTLGFMVLIEYLGFTITTFLFLASAMLLLSDGHHPSRVIGIAFGAALGGYLLFILAFETRFPTGPFENFMKSVIGG